jgi:hypothetical protein
VQTFAPLQSQHFTISQKSAWKFSDFHEISAAILQICNKSANIG